MARADRSMKPDRRRARRPGPRRGGATAKNVIGDDEREEVGDPDGVPWRHICRLSITWRDGREAIGTGWLCAPNLIVTAGHCVYSLRRGVGWAQRIVAAFPGGTELDLDAPDLRAPEGWGEGREEYDYGALILPRPLDDEGVIEARAMTEGDLSETIVVSGYPIDQGATLWRAEGAIALHPRTSRLLHHTIDTEIGESGSPLLCNEADAYRAIGVHVQGETAEANLAVAFIPGVIATLTRWAGGGA